MALLAQAWAGQGEPSPATYNQRLAILSSCYRYAATHELLPPVNPISRVERRPVHAYATAVALEYTEVRRRLKRIDRATLAGKRDYALLAVALQTGRRVAELAGLRWDAVRLLEDGKVKLFWQRTKGASSCRIR